MSHRFSSYVARLNDPLDIVSLLGYMSQVNSKKKLCRRVEFRGQEPLSFVPARVTPLKRKIWLLRGFYSKFQFFLIDDRH